MKVADCGSRTALALLLLLAGLPVGTTGAVALDVLPQHANVRPNEDAANARYVEGLKALAADKLADADKAFRGCLDVAPKAAPCMLGVATVAGEQGNLQESGAWIERAAAADPNSAEALESLGRWRAQNGRTAEAITALEGAARLNPKSVRARVDLGDIYLTSKNDVDRAIALYREALAIDPGHGGAHYALGAALLRKGDQAAAEKEFKQAAKLAPANPMPALALARMFQTSGDLKTAEKYAREAVTIQPGLLAARLTLGQILEQAGRYDEALRQYRDMSAAYPQLAAPYFYTGALLHQKGDLGGAAAEYQKALKIDPKFGLALNNLAMIELTRNKDPAKAEALARRAVAAAPGAGAFHDTLSLVLEAKGDLKGALAEEQQAVKLDPGDASFLARVGTLQSRLGKKNEAIASLTRALQMSTSFPGAADARKLLDSLKR